MVRYSMEHFTFIWGGKKKMTALKQKTGKKGDWFGSPTPCLCGYTELNRLVSYVTGFLEGMFWILQAG